MRPRRAGLLTGKGTLDGESSATREGLEGAVFDNRGVGQTDKPDIPYSIEMMADDTTGLLNALGIEQAHVLGTSMGGRIAAALVLKHPSRVKSLILVSTIVKSLKGTSMTWSRRLLPLLLKIPMIRGPHPYYAVAQQLEATRDFDCMDRLHEIQVPTLILHGMKDKSAPYELAEAMHSGIKGSKMLTFPGGHVFFLLRQKQFVEAIAVFLDHSKTHYFETLIMRQTLSVENKLSYAVEMSPITQVFEKPHHRNNGTDSTSEPV